MASAVASVGNCCRCLYSVTWQAAGGSSVSLNPAQIIESRTRSPQNFFCLQVLKSMIGKRAWFRASASDTFSLPPKVKTGQDLSETWFSSTNIESEPLKIDIDDLQYSETVDHVIFSQITFVLLTTCEVPQGPILGPFSSI